MSHLTINRMNKKLSPTSTLTFKDFNISENSYLVSYSVILSIHFDVSTTDACILNKTKILTVTSSSNICMYALHMHIVVHTEGKIKGE